MPRYKSRLSTKKKSKGGSIEGGSISGGAIKGGAIKGGAIKGGAIDGGAIRGGAIRGGAIIGGNVDNVVSKAQNVLSNMKPHHLINALETNQNPSRVFHYIKRAAGAHLGKTDRFNKHMNLIHEKLPARHPLLAPMRDIHRNANSFHHLVSALKDEAIDEPQGGGLFSSIKHAFKKVTHGVADAAKSVGHGISKGIQWGGKALDWTANNLTKAVNDAKSVAGVIDDVGNVVGMGNLGLSNTVGTLQDALNQAVKTGESIGNVVGDISKGNLKDIPKGIGNVEQQVFGTMKMGENVMNDPNIVQGLAAIGL